LSSSMCSRLVLCWFVFIFLVLPSPQICDLHAPLCDLVFLCPDLDFLLKIFLPLRGPRRADWFRVCGLVRRRALFSFVRDSVFRGKFLAFVSSCRRPLFFSFYICSTASVRRCAWSGRSLCSLGARAQSVFLAASKGAGADLFCLVLLEPDFLCASVFRFPPARQALRCPASEFFARCLFCCRFITQQVMS
jgi:hypothetical protein